ncbi:Mpo1 family 2-hydroxy fatty acid dioxygenase [Shewanella donghaensis]|uniref:Mpo1 family 2-hydroxy fatty acid dioxygenase n=1 Tax=Shewanella donghaensis TaxID=238836 RepID=UPI0011832F72|nr:Mpo1-like protein [Shewanella donghaensis]
MKSAVEQLATYKSVHLNPKNIRTHFVGVPLIIWAAFLMLNFIPVNLLSLPDFYINVNVATAFAFGILVYYFILHKGLALGLTIFIIPVLITTSIAAQQGAGWLVAIAVFVIGWIIQFIGHEYEKAKPAFVDDLNQLLIGPFFLMAELYFMLGFGKQLEEEITPIARDKRRALEAKKRGSSE